MQAVRIGVIGAGENGSGHAHYFRDCARSKVVAVADPDAGRGRALSAQCNADWVSDYRELLDRVDAVVISSPNRFHRSQAVDAAQAGLHVYCEKPVGLNAMDAQAMADAARRAGVRSVVGFSTRNGGNIQAIHRLQREGVFGDLISVWSRRMMYMASPALDDWRSDPEQSGGLLLEINIHELDWMMMVGGEVVRVFAHTRADENSASRANDHLWVMMSFDSGAVGQHEGSWRSTMPSFFRGVHGTRGGAQTDEWGQGLLVTREPGGERTDATVDQPFDLRSHFLDTIEHGAEPVCDLDWGVKVMRVADAVFESARTGKPVSLRRVEPVVRPASPAPSRLRPVSPAKTSAVRA